MNASRVRICFRESRESVKLIYPVVHLVSDKLFFRWDWTQASTLVFLDREGNVRYLCLRRSSLLLRSCFDVITSWLVAQWMLYLFSNQESKRLIPGRSAIYRLRRKLDKVIFGYFAKYPVSETSSIERSFPQKKAAKKFTLNFWSFTISHVLLDELRR